jgi:membrane protein
LSITRVLGAFDGWQRRHATAALAVAVARKFADDRASTLAALIAYYAFVSLFPLLLALVPCSGSCSRTTWRCSARSSTRR